MPCHSDRVRRNYITPEVTGLMLDGSRMVRFVRAEVTELQIHSMARSPRAWYDLARMTADQVYKQLVEGLINSGIRNR